MVGEKLERNNGLEWFFKKENCWLTLSWKNTAGNAGDTEFKNERCSVILAPFGYSALWTFLWRKQIEENDSQEPFTRKLLKETLLERNLPVVSEEMQCDALLKSQKLI